MNRPAFPLKVLGMVVAAAAAGSATAQQIVQLQQPKAIEINVERPTLSLTVEDNRLRTSGAAGSPTTKESTFDWSPTLGLLFDGSIYDARLLQFNLETETGFTRGRRRLDNGTGSVVTDDRTFTLQRYNGTINLMREKPYRASLFGSKSLVQRDYDQFNRFNADVSNYGGVLRGRSDRWNWDLRLSHADEKADSLDRPSTYGEDVLSASANNRRSEGSDTALRFDSRNFARQDADVPAYSGRQNTLYVLDQEGLSTNQDSQLSSALTVSDLSETSSDSQSLSLREDFRHEHRANLQSGLTYGYDQRRVNGASSGTHSGEAYIQHRLYQNLDSRLDLHGQRSAGEDDSEARYGPGLTERYTRKLGTFGRVGVNGAGRFERIASRTSESAVVTVIGEDVRLTDERPAFLSRPHVQTSGIVVTDASRARHYIEGVDYRVVQRGDYTEIQRVFGGAIPKGSTVQVDYPAQASASQTLEQVTRQFGFDLDLFQQRLLLSVNHQAATSSGAPTSRFADYQDTVLGAKSRWSWFEVGLEHVDHAADSLRYDGITYYADLFWDGGTLSAKLHAGQSSLDYHGETGKLDTTTYSATLGWSPVSTVTLQGFAGQYLESRTDGERDMLTLEGHLIFRYSRVVLDCTYRHENESTTPDHRETQYFLAELTRFL